MLLLNPEYLFHILLVFVRISGLLLAAPFFNYPAIPVRVRVLFAALLAFSLVGIVPGPLPAGVETPVGFIAALCVEALTGLLLGFAGQFIFWSLQFAGEIIGFQMGLSLAQAYDPSSGAPSNPAGRLLQLLFLLVFVLLDGHHHVLRALFTSFEVVPLAGARLSAGGPFLLSWTGAFVVTALRLSAPFMVTFFLIDTALGVLARVAPQADLFSISMPLKLIVGLGLVFFFVQHLMPIIPDLVQQLLTDLMELIVQITPT